MKLCLQLILKDSNTLMEGISEICQKQMINVRKLLRVGSYSHNCFCWANQCAAQNRRTSATNLKAVFHYVGGKHFLKKSYIFSYSLPANSSPYVLSAPASYSVPYWPADQLNRSILHVTDHSPSGIICCCHHWALSTLDHSQPLLAIKHKQE